MSDLDNTNTLLDTEAQDEQALNTAITNAVALIQSEATSLVSLQSQLAQLIAAQGTGTLVTQDQFAAIQTKINASIANITNQSGALNTAIQAAQAPPVVTGSPAAPVTDSGTSGSGGTPAAS